MKAIRFRLVILFSILLTLLVVGTVGFMLIEKLSPIDAIYFTVVTISTVGYGDIHASTVAGKVLALFLIIAGVGTFLGFFADGTQLLLQRREEQERKRRRNVLISLFFSELGMQILRKFSRYDTDAPAMRKDAVIRADWTDQDFQNLAARLKRHSYKLDRHAINLADLNMFLSDKGTLLSQLLENPNLQEHESFTDMLLALFHVRDELMARPAFAGLPATDLDHLTNDIRRVYLLLTGLWVSHLQYLKASYPYLYSLALRTNPFSEDTTAVVK
jgi:hypothetical protein